MRSVRWVSLALLTALFGSSSSALRAIEESTPRIVAVGDVHGSPEAFARVLRAAALIDASGAWIGGDSILVQTGDLTDRGPGVRAVLDLMRELEAAAERSGGRVVSLLGNHEVFNLIGYYDYQSTPARVFEEIAAAFKTEASQKTRNTAYRKWENWAIRYPYCAMVLRQDGSQPRLMTKRDWIARTPLGFVEYQEAFSPRGEYGTWLRKRPIVVNLGGTLFLHGGLSPELLEMGFSSLDAINAKAAADLEQFDRDREWLESEDVIAHRATLNEVVCAVNYEVNEARTEARKALFEELRRRLPNSESWFLLDPRGPVWFRGYASWSEETAVANLPPVLETFGGHRVVVGHTPQLGGITARFDNRVFLVDTAMAYPELEGRAVAIEFDGDSISAISEEGRVDLSAPTPEPKSEPSLSNEAGSHAVMGNLGHGVAGVYAALKHPEIFGKAAVKSPQVTLGAEDAVRELLASEASGSIQVYLDWNKNEARNTDVGFDLYEQSTGIAKMLEAHGIETARSGTKR